MNNILETVKKELRSTIRDKKSLIMMLITPLLIPLMILILSFVLDIFSSKEDTYIMGTNYTLNEIEQSIIDELNLEVIVYNNEEDLENAYDNDEIDVYIVYEDNTYKIYAEYTNTDSSMAASLASSYLETYNNYLANVYLTSINADSELIYNNINYEVNEIEEHSTSSYFANYIVTFALTLVIMSITSTAGYSATDSVAGEKERGTLETILTFPIKSEEIAFGKYIAVTISCIITAIISIILTLITMIICFNCFTIYDGVIFNFDASTIILVFIIMLSYSLFISGLSIAISSHSKSFKEAQSMLTPISFISMIPMFLIILDINLNPLLSLIPILSHTLLINDIFGGNISYINIIIMFISTIVYVILLIIYIKNQYKSEKALFS